jgi:TonB family protein
LLSTAWATVWAQQPAAGAAEPDPNAPSERAKRQADNPYKWIMILDDKPRPKKDDGKEKRGTPAAGPARDSAGTAVTSPNPATARAAERTVTPASAAATAPPTTPALRSTTPGQVESAAVPQVAAPEPALAAASPKLVEEELEEPLKPLKQVQPEMTRQILSANLAKGSVRVKYTVNTDGSVSNPEVVTSTNRVLNGPVLAALGKWQYEPIKKARETQAEIVFDFR